MYSEPQPKRQRNASTASQTTVMVQEADIPRQADQHVERIIERVLRPLNRYMVLII